MDIYVGSLNQTKINAVKNVFQPSDHIIARDVPSGVSQQPIGDKETRQGAIHRAVHAMNSDEAGLALGLEGGVMEIDGTLYLCNWGALVDTNKTVYTAAGARIELPQNFNESLEKGLELSDIMDRYVKKQDIRNHEGAIGIFTNERIDRTEMFTHIIKLLIGQMEYWNKKDN